jgi:hypothetical protein
MKHCKSHAPPFGVLLVAMLALVVFTPAFQSTASPPGTSVVTNEQYVLAPPDTGQQFIDDVANPADHFILVNGATTANIESFNTSFVIASANSIVTDIATGNIVANTATITANDNAPPGLSNSAAQNVVLPNVVAWNFKEVQGDAILHGFAGQTSASSTLVYRVDYDLLC